MKKKFEDNFPITLDKSKYTMVSIFFCLIFFNKVYYFNININYLELDYKCFYKIFECTKIYKMHIIYI